jgi:hypothetical protein
MRKPAEAAFPKRVAGKRRKVIPFYASFGDDVEALDQGKPCR